MGSCIRDVSCGTGAGGGWKENIDEIDKDEVGRRLFLYVLVDCIEVVVI